jgi:hypothetical protein
VLSQDQSVSALEAEGSILYVGYTEKVGSNAPRHLPQEPEHEEGPLDEDVVLRQTSERAETHLHEAFAHLDLQIDYEGRNEQSDMT